MENKKDVNQADNRLAELEDMNLLGKPGDQIKEEEFELIKIELENMSGELDLLNKKVQTYNSEILNRNPEGILTGVSTSFNLNANVGAFGNTPNRLNNFNERMDSLYNTGEPKVSKSQSESKPEYKDKKFDKKLKPNLGTKKTVVKLNMRLPMELQNLSKGSRSLVSLLVLIQQKILTLSYRQI